MCLLAISIENQPWQLGNVPNESAAHASHLIPSNPSLHAHCPDDSLQSWPEDPVSSQSQAIKLAISTAVIAKYEWQAFFIY